MTIDFDTPMTFYELLAIILAVIAIIIPILQWIWKKWVIKPVLNHLITGRAFLRSEEHTSELQSRFDLVCRLLLEKKRRRVHPPARPRLPQGAARLPRAARTHR